MYASFNSHSQTNIADLERKKIQEKYNNVIFCQLPETCSNTQELSLPYRNFLKPNYLFQVIGRYKCFWNTHTDKLAQRGWVRPVNTGFTNLASTLQTQTYGEIFDGTFNKIFFIWTANVRLVQQRSRMERHTSAYPWDSQKREEKKVKWEPQTKTTK